MKQPPFDVSIVKNNVWIYTGPSHECTRAACPSTPYGRRATVSIGIQSIDVVNGNFGKLHTGYGWIDLTSEGVMIL